MWKAWLTIGLLAGGAIFGLVTSLYYRKGVQKQKQDLLNDLMSDDETPVVQKNATVLDKVATKQMTGTYHIPGHRVVYLVKFSLGTNEDIPFEVSDVEFNRLQLGWCGKLTFQNGNYLDFEADVA